MIINFKQSEPNKWGDLQAEVSSAIREKLTCGTHAILFDFEHLNKIALVIVDEQHRFGVEQRSKIPHFLFSSDIGQG